MFKLTSVFLGTVALLLIAGGGFYFLGFGSTFGDISYATFEEEVIHEHTDHDHEVSTEEVVEVDSNRLLPDLIPFPPQDLRLSGGGSRLHFSTTYYNAGRGPLELTADPSKSPHQEDVERDVTQNILLADGAEEGVESGTFYWHETHQHYHFQDFVDYKVESIENFNYVAEGGRTLTPLPADVGNTEKATFCVRDISRVSGVPNTATDAAYKICSRWRQGVSVGWGDTYFHDYPDQFLDITDFPSGQYRLSFSVNPRKRFEESSYENNYSYVVVEYNKENVSIDILETFPSEIPDIEHVYPEQIF